MNSLKTASNIKYYFGNSAIQIDTRIDGADKLSFLINLELIKYFGNCNGLT